MMENTTRERAMKRVNRSPWRACVGTMLSAVFLLSGCAIPPERNWSPEEHSQPTLSLILAPGDEVGVTFLGAADLSTTQRIRRDGCISLKLVGEYKAAGKTPGEVKKDLLKLYESQIQVKEAEIQITSPAPIFIAGAVLKPGRLESDRPITALEAIMELGGFDETKSEVRSVVVIRHADGTRQGYYLNFKDALAGKDCHPFYLQPFDIVYVPRTAIVKVNQWVDQHVNKLLPHLGATYRTGDFYMPL